MPRVPVRRARVAREGIRLSRRRNNQPGLWANGLDSVPIDEFGGWRENWSVYCVNRKESGPTPPRFKDSDHPQAAYLRMDTQGVVTNPRILARQAQKQAAGSNFVSPSSSS